jgi:hypothetical protein
MPRLVGPAEPVGGSGGGGTDVAIILLNPNGALRAPKSRVLGRTHHRRSALSGLNPSRAVRRSFLRALQQRRPFV